MFLRPQELSKPFACYELRKAGPLVARQEPIALVHEQLEIKIAFRADLIINGKVLVELKTVEDMPKTSYKKLLTYLKLTNLTLGLLINFGETLIKHGIHRVVNGL